MGQPGGGGGLGGAGAELAMGMAMAQQMMNQPGGMLGQQQTPGIQAPQQSQAAPELLTPAQVAQMLNVSEADVTASLEAGDLKGRRIGSQWRITRAAVDSFLHG
jgi:excisionase family DNA binding protein